MRELGASLWPGEMAGVVVSGADVLLVNVEGRLCAYRDRCPHAGVRLSEGRLDGKLLTCRAHGWSFDVGTAASVNPPGKSLEAVVLPDE